MAAVDEVTDVLARRGWWSIRVPAGGGPACTSLALVDGTRVDLAVESRHPDTARAYLRAFVLRHQDAVTPSAP